MRGGSTVHAVSVSVPVTSIEHKLLVILDYCSSTVVD